MWQQFFSVTFILKNNSKLEWFMFDCLFTDILNITDSTSSNKPSPITIGPNDFIAKDVGVTG